MKLNNRNRSPFYTVTFKYKLLQEGWLSPTEPASVSAISLRHIFASPGYVPGTIAVSVTWMERGFNAGQTQSIYPSSYSEILVGNCNFFLPLVFNAPVGVFPLEIREMFGPQKTRMMGLSGSEDNLTIGWAVSTQYQRVTDRRGQTDSLYEERAQYDWHTLIKVKQFNWIVNSVIHFVTDFWSVSYSPQRNKKFP